MTTVNGVGLKAVTTCDDDNGVEPKTHDKHTSLLPDVTALQATGDPGAMLAALVTTSAHAQKEVARELKKSAEAMEDAAVEKQVAAMRAQAVLAMASGIVSGIGQAASGALGIAGGLQSTEADAAKFSGMAKLAEAGSKLDSTLLTFGSSECGADATAAGHDATIAKRGSEAAAEELDDAKKLAQKAIDFYSQWVEGKAAAMSAALHRS